MSEAETSNLTGGQIQEALDFLIYKGLEPVVLYSNIFDIQLVHLLGVASTNKKRKISALPREEFLNVVSNALLTNDRELKLRLITEARIERGFVYRFLVGFIEATAGYIDNYTKKLCCSDYGEIQRLERKISSVERHVGFTRAHLFSTIRVVTGYVNLAYEFRNQIVTQYVRHAYKQAHKFCKEKSGHFDFEDLNQTLMAAITKAIDKYDSSKGALTSYINYWILNAMTYSNPQFGYEYGVSYSIPQVHRKAIQGSKASEVNFSVSLEKTVGEDDSSLKDFLIGSLGVDKELEEHDELTTMQYLVKTADPEGIVRLYYDLGEHFSYRELLKMAKNMVKEFGYVPANADLDLPSDMQQFRRSL